MGHKCASRATLGQRLHPAKTQGRGLNWRAATGSTGLEKISLFVSVWMIRNACKEVRVFSFLSPA
jgi:hypothetical protein